MNNPFIGYAEREYLKWLKENPIETWQDITDGAEMHLRLIIDEEILVKIFEVALTI